MAQKKKPKTISIAMTGSGGTGVMTAGQMLLDAAAQAGLYGMMTRSMGPQIRGGEAAAFVRLSTAEVACSGDGFDILVAFDWEGTTRFKAEINMQPGSVVLKDPSSGDVPEMFTGIDAQFVDLPLKEMAKGIEGGRPNMVCLGTVAALAGVPKKEVLGIVKKALGRKGDEALKASTSGIEAGYEAAKNFDVDFKLPTSKKTESRWNISGNEAMGLGAIRGGIRFVAAYPITPATEVLEWLSPNLEKVGGELVQAEDELASVNMVIGGSFGGVPSLTATSGPGLALMTEAIGLSVCSETPVVVVDVQRGGPSTGIPTKSEQSDLNIAIYGLHGDAPHIVTAATSVGDGLFTTQWSVHLAEKLQCPAIVMTDQAMGQTRSIIDGPEDSGHRAARELAPDGISEYRRYSVTASGVSPMAVPGIAGGQYVADGLEHAPSGRPSSMSEDHQEQLDKRERKLEGNDFGDYWGEIIGEGDIAIVTWGSATGPSRDAQARAIEEGRKVKLIALRLLLPAQVDKFHEAIEGVEKVLVVEQSHSKQFHHYLRAHYDLPKDVKVFARPGPLPIRPVEIYQNLVNWS